MATSLDRLLEVQNREGRGLQDKERRGLEEEALVNRLMRDFNVTDPDLPRPTSSLGLGELREFERDQAGDPTLAQLMETGKGKIVPTPTGGKKPSGKVGGIFGRLGEYLGTDEGKNTALNVLGVIEDFAEADRLRKLAAVDEATAAFTGGRGNLVKQGSATRAPGIASSIKTLSALNKKTADRNKGLQALESTSLTDELLRRTRALKKKKKTKG